PAIFGVQRWPRAARDAGPDGGRGCPDSAPVKPSRRERQIPHGENSIGYLTVVVPGMAAKWSLLAAVVMQLRNAGSPKLSTDSTLRSSTPPSGLIAKARSTLPAAAGLRVSMSS